ncbi:MaoC family dehydratase [Nocardioides sp. GXZ039]|uniref:MaoC family dehydratase n=1 Tax=Nocardioides sp. GXZ039 TaxID=3136018 RepID=UPI0030F3F37A
MKFAREYEMSQRVIDAWADLSGDHNPLHVDIGYAEGTRFGGTIAHGHYTLAVIEDLLLESWGERWLRGGVLRDLRFRAPVRPGGRYRVMVGEPDGGQAHVEVVDMSDGTLVVEGLAVQPC